MSGVNTSIHIYSLLAIAKVASLWLEDTIDAPLLTEDDIEVLFGFQMTMYCPVLVNSLC